MRWQTTSRDDLIKELERQQEQIRELERERTRLERERDRLRREREWLRRKIDHLEDELDAARRAGFRQAAPFSKGVPTATPRRPGRRAGAAYGRVARRPVPTRVDETYDVPLPPCCPHCGSDALTATDTTSQYQEDLPVVQPIVRAFAITIGRCRGCGRRVQGRHPLQTSDAVGAAAVHLGPQAVSLVATLHTQYGLPFGKVADLLRTRFGLSVTPGGLAHVLHRTAGRAQPTYAALQTTVRAGPIVTADETGWKVGGSLQWLWGWVTPDTTVYAIQPGRGFEEAAAVLGADFDGCLVRDGWAPYRQFTHAVHQTCLAHLLRRCRLLERDHGDTRFAPQVATLLQQGLTIRDRWRAGQISDHGVATARGQVTHRLNRVLDTPGLPPRIDRFARHLSQEFPALFMFLVDPAIDATNWRAEHALRPAVVTRKVCGGNRTWRGAQTQQILASVLRTATQREVDVPTLFTVLLRTPHTIDAFSAHQQ